MAHSHHRHSFFCLGAVHARQVCGGAEGKERAHAYLSASVDIIHAHTLSLTHTLLTHSLTRTKKPLLTRSE